MREKITIYQSCKDLSIEHANLPGLRIVNLLINLIGVNFAVLLVGQINCSNQSNQHVRNAERIVQENYNFDKYILNLKKKVVVLIVGNL